jgi:hypothetical protein
MRILCSDTRAQAYTYCTLRGYLLQNKSEEALISLEWNLTSEIYNIFVGKTNTVQ